MTPHVSCVTLVTDESLYQTSVGTLVEQFPAGAVQVIPVYANQLGMNAAQGLNHGIEQACAEWVICMHQDVLIPDGWWNRVQVELAKYKAPGKVAVIGLVGATRRGELVGHILDPHGHGRWGRLPTEVVSIDEHVIVVRKDSPVRFDPANPGFHVYGTDIAMQARQHGCQTIVIDAPVVHLSGGEIDPMFASASQWLLSKWGPTVHGVLPSPAMTHHSRSLTPLSLLRRLEVSLNWRLSRRRSGQRHRHVSLRSELRR